MALAPCRQTCWSLGYRTENIWHFAPVSGRRVEIDMREVTSIDDAGRRLLRTNESGRSAFYREWSSDGGSRRGN